MPVTVWVKRMDVAGARYDIVKNVDTGQLVAEFIARWVAQEKLDAAPSLVSLRLVKCGARKPSAEEEKQAVELDDPSLSLGDVNITGTAWLLAFVAGVDTARFFPGAGTVPGTCYPAASVACGH